MTWLPGGTPQPRESVASCVRRQVAEETGLDISVDRVAFVLEASSSAEGIHLLDLVFTVTETDPTVPPHELETGLTPIFCALEEVTRLDCGYDYPSPAIARAAHARRPR